MTGSAARGIFRAVRIYLDHNATSPLCEAAHLAMTAWLGPPTNASSVHAEGRAARAAVEQAREQVADALGAGAAKEIVFFGGATEANNTVILGASGSIVTTAVEHPSVLAPAEANGAVILPVDAGGRVRLEALERALSAAGDGALVSVIWASNETGVMQPIAEIRAICRAFGALLHVDGSQVLGKLAVDVADLGADLCTVSAHKTGGPAGVGALWIRRGLKWPALLVGGPQERGRRAGTENVLGIVGFGAACGVIAERLGHRVEVEALSTRLREGLLGLGAVDNGDGARLYNTVNARFPGAEAESLLMALDLAGIAASAGSACAAGSLEPSHVLLAMGRSEAEARASLRFSLGPETRADEIDETLGVMRDALAVSGGQWA